MKLQRDWITPITMGAFGLLGVTGVLMFFHADSALNKSVHEIFSWVLLGAAALHAAVNWTAVRRHLAGWRGRAAVGVFALVLAVSFAPLGGSSEPPFLAPVRALADAPLPVLAQVARVTPEQMRERLQAAGVPATNESDTVRGLVGPDVRRQVRVLSQVIQVKPSAL